jgi:hypothetical protein
MLKGLRVENNYKGGAKEGEVNNNADGWGKIVKYCTE